jgi:hypothetical protein
MKNIFIMELENKIMNPEEWFNSEECKNENLWLNIKDYTSYILAEQSHFINSNSWRGFEITYLAEEFNKLICAKN